MEEGKVRDTTDKSQDIFVGYNVNFLVNMVWASLHDPHLIVPQGILVIHKLEETPRPRL